MGCFSSKTSQGGAAYKASDARKSASTPAFESLTSVENVPVLKRERTTLSDFNVLYTDLIGERTGRIHDTYSLLSPPIGKGSFGEVRRAIHQKSNMTRAIKIISKAMTGKEEQQKLVNEVNILKKLDHPNIMKVYEFFQDEDYFYIVSEFYNGGELFDKITEMKEFSEQFAAKTMKQILSAISYCHINKIVHRDLKPENILLESKAPNALLKIIDFGTSRLYNPETPMHQRFGTPYYIAPEVLKKNYTEKCDEWSCGVILYVLLCGFPPFNAKHTNDIFGKILKGDFSFNYPEWDNVSDQAKNLICRLLDPNIETRISAEEALSDPWFKMMLGETTVDKPLAVSALANLKQFKAEKKLKDAAWIFLVSLFASKEEKSQLLKTFQALDLNGDGLLSKEELIKGYETLMNSPDPEKEVEEIMKSVDNDKSGTIDYTEFVIATVNRNEMLKKEKLEAAFRLLDKDGDGHVTAAELDEIFNPGHEREIEGDVWPELIKEVDQNGDGKISFEEFQDMMTKIRSMTFLD